MCDDGSPNHQISVCGSWVPLGWPKVPEFHILISLSIGFAYLALRFHSDSAICDLESRDLICDLRFGLRSAIPESRDSSAICDSCDSDDFFAILEWVCDLTCSAIRNRCHEIAFSATSSNKRLVFRDLWDHGTS